MTPTTVKMYCVEPKKKKKKWLCGIADKTKREIETEGTECEEGKPLWM